MAYYSVCPYCGNNLDPGEKCDCKEREEEVREYKKEIKKIILTEKSGQMAMFLEGRRTV